MAKKRAMSDPEYESYHRIHDYDHPVEVERGKVRREKTNSARMRRKAQQRIKHQLRQISHPDDVADWDDDLPLDEDEWRAERELNNARTHKQRLHQLEAREDTPPPDDGTQA